MRDPESVERERNSLLPRRTFLRQVGVISAGVAATMASPASSATTQATTDPAGAAIPLRSLGRHADVKITALGLGGHHLGDADDLETAIRIVHAAIDGGIRFFDNCWEYHNGKSENWLGRALKGKRDDVFLMTKVCTHGRSGALGMQILEQSLLRLQTDHLDLWQLHGMGFDNDPELAYAPGGALEALDKAKQQGKVRFVGFTGHKDPDVHLKLVTMGYPWDSVQMPLNPFDSSFLSFEQVVLPELCKRGIAALGMKSMGGTGEPIKKGTVKADELLRYAMSLPGVATTVAGIDSMDVLKQNLAIAQNSTPMSPAEMDALRQRCRDPAGDGRFEPYKVSLKYDNPQARVAHQFPIDAQQKEIKDLFEDVSSPTPPH